MSARQPFIPQHLAARASSTPTIANSETNSDEAFRANGLLSDPAASKDKQDAQAAPQNYLKSWSSHPSDSETNSLANGINKPLNISGFKKKKPHASQNGASFRQKSFEDSASRARSPQPHGLRIAAPRPCSPFFPSPSSLTQISNFRPSRLSSPSKLHESCSADDLNANKAHTPTPQVQDGFSQATNNTIPNELKNISASAHSSFDKTNEAGEEEDKVIQQQYEAREHLHGAPGAPRRPFDEDLSSMRSRNHQAALYDLDAGSQSYIKQPSNKVINKRLQRTDEVDEDGDYGTTAKRYKMDMICDERQIEYMPPYSRHATPATQYHLQDHPPTPKIQGHNQGRPSVPYQDPSALREPAQEEHVLRRLLGRDLDAYVNNHLDAYEASKKKWAERSVEEWQAGADDLAGKFAEMIDLVKDHMTTKLTLYASLHSTLAAHRTVLSERDKALKGVREALVRDGGNVVGNRTGVQT